MGRNERGEETQHVRDAIDGNPLHRHHAVRVFRSLDMQSGVQFHARLHARQQPHETDGIRRPHQ